MMRRSFGWAPPLMFAIVALTGLHAQYAAPPTAYTVIETNAMFGPTVTIHIYRDGDKALMDQSFTTGGKTNRVRGLYDLAAQSTISWDPGDPAIPCGRGSFSGDWGDPFSFSAGMNADIAKQNAKPVGTETVNGIPTKVFATESADGATKVWIDQKYGLIVKLVTTPKTGPPQTIIEVTKLVLGKPAPTVFALPPACAALAKTPPPPTEAERIAALTGDDAGHFANAIMPPPSNGSCNAVFRVVQAGSMQPLTGFQVAVDTRVDPDHPAHYVMGLGSSGHSTFSGGGLHEITAAGRNGTWRIPNLPPQFEMELTFGDAGAASALLYRQCFAPDTALLLVVKNPQKLSDGAEWLWVKSGKYAAGK